MSINNFKAQYDDRHWLKLYIEIRNIETNKNLPQNQMDLIIKNALDLHKYKSKISALDYIQGVFGGFSDQISKIKSLTEQEIVATIQNVQSQSTTTGY